MLWLEDIKQKTLKLHAVNKNFIGRSEQENGHRSDASRQETVVSPWSRSRDVPSGKTTGDVT